MVHCIQAPIPPLLFGGTAARRLAPITTQLVCPYRGEMVQAPQTNLQGAHRTDEMVFKAEYAGGSSVQHCSLTGEQPCNFWSVTLLHFSKDILDLIIFQS